MTTLSPDTDTSPAPSDPRIGYQPALDGLRGLAVAGVVAFHLGHLSGGFLGVDLFFTLSGYLITRLLLVERAAKGGVDLRRFWTRRARRLLPALYALLAATAVYAAWFARPDELAGIRGGGISALAYVANWWAIVTGDGYWDLFTTPSPLEHLWSLSIEEQFYVVWPLAVVFLLGAALRMRRLLIVSVIAAVASAVLMAVLASGDLSDAYLNTFTRVGSMLVGAIVAIALHRRAGAPVSDATARALQIGGLLSAALLAWMWFVVDGTNTTIYRGGFLLHAAAVGVIIVAITIGPNGPAARMFRMEPLRQLGLVSYGVYLWHWPVIVIANSERTGLEGAALLVTRLGITTVLTVASYVLLEQPIRHSKAAPRTVGIISIGAALVLAAALFVTTIPETRTILAGPAPTLPPRTTDTAATTPATSAPPTTAAVEAAAGAPSVTLAEPADTAPPTTLEAADATDDAANEAAADRGILQTEPPLGPAVVPIGEPVNVLLTGDSFMFDAEPGITAALTAGGGANVAEEARFGFRITDDGWESVLEEQVALADPDVVIAMWARFDAAWLQENDPDEYRARLDRAVEILTSNGATLGFVGLAPSLSGGVDPTPVDRSINGFFRELPERFPGSVFYIDPDPVVAPTGEFELLIDVPEGQHRVRKTDGNHYCPDGSARFGLAIGQFVETLTGLAQVDPAVWWGGEWRSDSRYDEPAGSCS
ncbi:MAG: acyltransferase family protein [Actinomycetota bacterium]